MEDQSFNQELIVQYLLGDLPDEVQVRIEDRAFSDERVLDNILDVENDLIDEYVRGGLSQDERRRFENKFLASHERRQKVEFARALAVVSEESSVQAAEAAPRRAVIQEQTSWWNSLKALLAGASPLARFATAVVLIALVLNLSSLIIDNIRLRGELRGLRAEQETGRRQQEELERQAAQERQRSENLAAEVERERAERERAEELAARAQKQSEATPPPGPKKAETTRAPEPLIASLFLAPGISRGAAVRRELVVPRAARLARLQVGLEPGDDYKSFRVELSDSSGRVIWSRDRLRAQATGGGRAVVLNLPANILSAGDYELALKGVNDNGAIKDVGYYYFSVLKK